MSNSFMKPLLQKINSSLILEIEELKLTSEIEKGLGIGDTKIARKNSKLLNIYRIIYKSQNYNVVGFIVEPKKGAILPCVIYNRGGSGDFGKIKIENLFIGQITQFALNGYIVIASQYRGNDGQEGIDDWGGENIEDILNLYKILTRYKRADIKKIGMYGGSRGGAMTYIVNSKVKWLKAIATKAGVADLILNTKQRPEMQKNFKIRFGGSKIEKIKRSALYWTEKFPKNVPVLMMHGTSDWRVSPTDSLRLAQKLLEQKVPYRLIMYEGGDHQLTDVRKESTYTAIQWFDRFVKNREKLPNMKPHGK